MGVLIRGGRCVLPSGTSDVDVWIEGERIAAIGSGSAPIGAEVVDATGLYVLPGVIDDQVHFRDPGLTHKEDLRTGSLAAAKGGVTTFLEMPNTAPATTSRARLRDKLAIASKRSIVDFGFYIGATPDNIDELRAARDCPGIKIFIGSSTGDLLVDEQDALERIFADTTLPLTAHCEDEATVRANRERCGGARSVADHSRIRDHAAAVIATRRAIELAHRHEHRFHVLHVSTADEIPVINDHRDRVTAEACPHHLFLNIDDYERLGSRAQMNPSLKTAADNRALWQALIDGKIQVIATDHAPHTLEEKAAPYPESPSGLPAVENSLALLLDRVHRGHCTIERVVDWMCDAPARVWDIVGKGRIAEGYDADLVLVDLDREHTLRDAEQQTKSKWTPWHGTTLRGLPLVTWVRGHRVFDRGVFDASQAGRSARYDHSRGGYWRTRD